MRMSMNIKICITAVVTLTTMPTSLVSTTGQELYSEFFGAAPFALRGGPPGTTERLRQWCAALARCISTGS
eukprot:8010309-Karenia_brevis.AAC.1